jgi:tRNA (cytidine32/uridine32-2'-O)-methyltransferase
MDQDDHKQLRNKRKNMIQHDFVVILERTSHPGNIGATARAMKNMGMQSLRLVNCTDHRVSDAYTRSSGAEDILHHAQTYSTLQHAMEDCHLVLATSGRRRSEQRPPTICARKLPKYLQAIDEKKRIALLFGNEQNGLDNDAIQQAHCQIIVPTNPDFRSLNLAACVQLITFQCQLEFDREDSQEMASNLATQAQYNAILETATRHAFDKKGDRLASQHKLRQLLYRTNPTSDELSFLHGIIKRAANKEPNDDKID